MHATKSRTLGIIAIATALVTLLVLGFLCYQDWKRYEIADKKIHESRRILTLNETLLNGMRDAETGQRGFLLTGRDEYLERYQAAVKLLPAEMGEMASLLKNDSVQSARFQQLQALIADKFAELRRTIELRQSGQAAAALARVETGQGKQIMDRLRNVSAELENVETERWQSAWDGLTSGAEHLRLMTLLGSVLLVILVAIGAWALKRAATDTDRLIAELDVSKRTAEQGRDLLRATLYSIGDGVIATDGQGAVQMMNAVAERLTGYAEAQARGVAIEKILSIVNESTRNTVENPIRQVLRAAR